MNSKPVHHGISCNECKITTIQGKRYKCLNCVHYELCGVCIDYTLHSLDHVFALIKRPIDLSDQDRPLLSAPLYKKEGLTFPPFFPSVSLTEAPELVHNKGHLYDSIVKGQQQQNSLFGVETPNSLFGDSPPSSFFGFMPELSARKESKVVFK